MQTCSVFSPAKVNFFLAVTGRRTDGFHDIVSIAAPVDFGDTLNLSLAAGDSDTVGCLMADVPTDGTNLVLRAAKGWRAAGGVAPPIHFEIEKRIPPGSGLGGGSSNAVAALRGLEQAAENPLGAGVVMKIAESLGSDCPLFLSDGPVVMRGRGERIETLESRAIQRLRGAEIMVCRPRIGVDTSWAYGQLADQAPGSYLESGVAEARVSAWLSGSEPNDSMSFNSFEQVAFAKFVALPVLGQRLQARHGLALRLSGSGSACFAWLNPKTDWVSLIADVRDAFGENCFVERARVGAGMFGNCG